MHLLNPSFLSPLLLLLSIAPTPSLSSSLTITIPPSTLLPNPNTLPAGTHATLTQVQNQNQNQNQNERHISTIKAPLTRSATFVFDLDEGNQHQHHSQNGVGSGSGSGEARTSYLLDIRSAEYVFVPYRVDLDVDGRVLGIWETFRGNAWENRGVEKFALKGGAGAVADVIVDAKVIGRKGFYEVRQKFSPLTLFKNPMILLAIVALAFTFGMPKLMENMDPEMRAEFEKQTRSSPLSAATQNGGGPGNFDLAGWMAGATPQSGSVSVSEETAGARGAASGRENRGAARRR